MLKAEQRLTPDPDVIYTPLEDGEAVLFHMPTTTYFSLNPTGVRIWELMSQDMSLAQIGGELAREYDVTPEQAEQSVLRLAQALAKAELVQQPDEEA